MFFCFLASKKMMNFKELFVYYDNLLAFYCFLKIHKKVLIQNLQDRIGVLFDMGEIILDKRLAIRQKHAHFLRLLIFYKNLLDDLVEILQRSQ